MKALLKSFEFAAILIFVVVTWGCGPGEYVPTPNEELYGTWTNGEYDGVLWDRISPQKIAIDRYGFGYYRKLSDRAATYTVGAQIAGKWKDAEGNVWYKTHGMWGSKVFQQLNKLSKSGTVLEYMTYWHAVYNDSSYPTKIDLADAEYRIYYRARN